MDAYVERFSGGLVRVGAARHGEPYLYSVTYDDTGEYAEIKGFYQRHIPRVEFELVVSQINEASGKLVCYQRMGQALTVQIDPRLTKGKIIMHKHHVSEAKHEDGSVNQNVAVQHALEACVSILAGKLKLVSMDQQNILEHPGRMKFTFEADAV